jgi:hypothetical protein
MIAKSAPAQVENLCHQKSLFWSQPQLTGLPLKMSGNVLPLSEKINGVWGDQDHENKNNSNQPYSDL